MNKYHVNKLYTYIICLFVQQHANVTCMIPSTSHTYIFICDVKWAGVYYTSVILIFL